MQEYLFFLAYLKSLHYLCTRIWKKCKQGTLPEWLGTGLQNRGQRFESARYLQKELSHKTALFY